MNSTFITGRLFSDASLGQTKNGTPVARFYFASDKGGNARRSNMQEQPEANSVPCTLYGKKAEAFGEYLKKGKPFAIFGSIRTERYTNKDGKTVFSWDNIIDRIEFLPDGAMASTNIVTITGRLCEDAKQSFTKNGACVTEMRVACDRHDKERNADFIPVTLYGRLGESLGRYLVKGKSVTIIGELETGSYKNAEGTTVYTWRVVADKFKLNGDGKKDKTAETSEDQADAQEAQEVAAKPEEESSETGFVELPKGFDDEYFDEDY